jgi:hypothetical protein
LALAMGIDRFRYDYLFALSSQYYFGLARLLERGPFLQIPQARQRLSARLR